METIATRLNNLHEIFEENKYDTELLSYIYNLANYSHFNKTYQHKLLETINLIENGCHNGGILEIKPDSKEGFKVNIYDNRGIKDLIIDLNKGKDVMISHEECDYKYPYVEEDPFYEREKYMITTGSKYTGLFNLKSNGTGTILEREEEKDIQKSRNKTIFHNINKNREKIFNYDDKSLYETFRREEVDQKVGFKKRFKLYVSTSELPEKYSVITRRIDPTTAEVSFRDLTSLHPVTYKEKIEVDQNNQEMYVPTKTVYLKSLNRL